MKKILYSLVGLGVIIFVYVSTLLYRSGILRPVHEITFGHCKKIGVIPGPEDMALIPGTRQVIISSDPRSVDFAAGYLFSYDLDTQKLNPIGSGVNFPFHPHGMDSLKESKDSTLVYVINHRSESLTTIEIFTEKVEGGLRWEKSLFNPLFQSGNDLVVVSPEKFYLTSDHGTPSPQKQEIEHLTFKPSGYVTFYNGITSFRVAENIFFANGILVSPDQSRLMVAGMIDQEIVVYDLKQNPISKIKTIPLEGAPDNLTWYGDKIYAAVHPHLLALKAMGKNRLSKSPSKIIEISGWDSENLKSKTIYENKGDEIAAASVALEISENRILIGSVFDDHFLDCSRP